MEIPRKLIEDVAWDSDIDTDEGFHWNYSGRGMYGQRTWGIVGSMSDYSRFLVTLASRDEEGQDLAWELAQRVATDSMAYDTIFYFPGTTVSE